MEASPLLRPVAATIPGAGMAFQRRMGRLRACLDFLLKFEI
jgi:hypothetical protein